MSQTKSDKFNFTDRLMKLPPYLFVEIDKMKQEALLKAQLMEQEFNYNLQLRNVSEEALASRESKREDAKSKRISQQNTEQSKLINQRKNNLPPQNFESNEDSLDGFDFAEFNPR